MHWSRAAFALRGLNVSIPRGAADVDAPSCFPLQAQHLTRARPGHGKNREHRLVWLGSCFDDLLHLFRGEESRLAPDCILCELQGSEVLALADVSPLPCFPYDSGKRVHL